MIPAARIVVPEEDIAWIVEQVRAALRSGQLTLGAQGRAFEEEFSAWLGVRHAVAVASGTAALEIILRSLGVAGREVLVPTNTFFATAAAVAHAGGIIRFVDVNPQTLCVDADILAANLTDRTAAAIVVHIGGIIPPDVLRMQALCAARGVALIEDAAHAHGSTLEGRKAGTFGRAAAFSFYPTKVMTSGEGGMIVTDDETLAQEARIYRDQGKAAFSSNVHTRLGANWRLGELHAAVGRAQLRRLDEFLAQRRAAAAWYDAALRGLAGIAPLPVPPGVASNYYKYPVMLEPGVDRLELKRRLREQHGVSLSGEVYELPCHRQPVFAPSYGEQPLPAAEDVCRRHACLPIYAGMRQEEVCAVVNALAEALAGLEAGSAVNRGVP